MKKTVIIFCKYENHARFWFNEYLNAVHPVGKVKRQRIDTPELEVIFTGEARLKTIASTRRDPAIIYWDRSVGNDISELVRLIGERAA